MNWPSFELDLRDGTPIQVRPVAPGDEQLVHAGFDHLSERSRYFRFFRSVEHLSDEELEKFVEVDQRNHIAFGAVGLTHAESYPLGLARCIRLVNEPTAAEVAIAVVDSHHGRGVGTILLAAVAYAAAKMQIATFVAHVLNNNREMLDLFGELGGTSSVDEPNLTTVRMPIYSDTERYPDTPAIASFKRVYGLMG